MNSQASDHRKMKKVRVWDPIVRAFHWTLASLFLANFLELTRAGKLPHQIIGYVAVGLVVLRVVWGFVGTRHARFSDFVHRPREIVAFMKSMFRHEEARHIGHNPAGGAMTVALLVGILLIGLTGWMQVSDRFFGAQWVETAHVVLVNLLFVMVVAHVLGVIHASWRHRENLVTSMITGRKRALTGGQNAITDRRG